MEKDRKEGIKGMANPGRYGIERVAYWLMRITGLGLLVYLLVIFTRQAVYLMEKQLGIPC